MIWLYLAELARLVASLAIAAGVVVIALAFVPSI